MLRAETEPKRGGRRRWLIRLPAVALLALLLVLFVLLFGVAVGSLSRPLWLTVGDNAWVLTGHGPEHSPRGYDAAIPGPTGLPLDGLALRLGAFEWEIHVWALDSPFAQPGAARPVR